MKISSHHIHQVLKSSRTSVLSYPVFHKLSTLIIKDSSNQVILSLIARDLSNSSHYVLYSSTPVTDTWWRFILILIQCVPKVRLKSICLLLGLESTL